MRLSPAATGVAAMLLSTVVTALMGLSVKSLHALAVGTAEMTALRSAIVLLVLMPPLLSPARRREVLRAHKRFQLLHGFLGLTSMACFYYALATVPLMAVTAISFTMPMFIAVLAVPLLNERLGLPQALALVLGFAGALLIVRPAADAISADAALVLLGSALGALQLIVLRRMPEGSSNLAVLVWYAWFGTAAFGLFALAQDASLPAGIAWAWLVALALLALLLQWLYALAFRLAPSSMVGGLDYLRLLWAGLIGYLAFAEVPSLLDILGTTMILCSGIAILWRESRAIFRRANPSTLQS